MIDPWLTPRDAALAVARPIHSVWTWVRRGKVAAKCDLATRQVLVNLRSLADHAETSEQRWTDRERHAHRRRGAIACKADTDREQ